MGGRLAPSLPVALGLPAVSVRVAKVILGETAASQGEDHDARGRARHPAHLA